MGKSQKKRAMRRHNPMRVPDTHLPQGLASASQTSSKSQAVLPIIQKMDSPESGDRKWACVAVSNLIQNDPSTRRLLQGKNIVGSLITRLTDSEEEVVIEAAGTLRNLCIDGGYDICAEMYNKNILTPLRTFVPKISTTLSQFLAEPKSAPGNAQKIVYEFADNVITILWCLSETSNKALNVINEIHLVPFLMSFLASRDKLPLATVTSAAQSLYVLTDDNHPAISEVRSDASYISCLLSITRSAGPTNDDARGSDPRTTTLSVLSAGILRNILPIPPPSVVSFVDMDKDVVLPLLQPIISSVSLQDISNHVQELIARQESEPQVEKLSLKNTPKSDHKSSIEIELQRLEEKLKSIQLSLEILTGVCATLPDPVQNGEPKDVDNDDENLDEDVDLDDGSPDVEMTEAEKTISETISSPFLHTLLSPLLTLVYPTSLSFPPLSAPSLHPPTTSALSAIHISALECLNNIFLPFSTSINPKIKDDKESGRKIWNDIWAALSIVGTQTSLGQERRQEVWEVAIGVLWGVGNIWRGSLEPNVEYVRILIQFFESVTEPNIHVKCIGTLECLAQHPESVEANRIIADYLLSILPPEPLASVAGTDPILQAASALIDIYSDEESPYDINFRQGNYLDKLIRSVDGVKKIVKSIDRRKPGGMELRRRGEEVRDNLIAFIQYRKDLGI